MTVELAHPSTEPLGSRSPTEPAHPRWWFISTTPGRILTIGIILAALGGATAFATSTTINHRQQALSTVLNHTEPLAYAAGQLYTTLSVADAAAATAFIAQAEPRTVRQRYEQAITDAAVAVTRASSGLTDEPLGNCDRGESAVLLLGRINAELSVYTGLIEIARTNNRAGNPVGASYLSEASALMQSTILPDAQCLYQATSARVDSETTASTQIPAPVILVVATTVVFGAYSHRWLARRTKRRINPGLVAGALAILVMVIWVGTALTISTTGSRNAKNTAAESLKTITNLSITAQQARADETLSLIRRGDEDVRKQSFYQRIDSMHQQLEEYLSRPDAVDKTDLQGADQLLARWRQANDRINTYIAVGNYRAATEVALGHGEDDSTPAFDKLDEALGKTMEQSRDQLRTDILNARRGLSGATVGGVVLSLSAAIAVALGLWPRLNEYR
ncbi:MAG TPA: protein kinase G-activating protein GlnX [Mycobacterium sp.]|uniref:protein kinase G-activating protein GlnX n=1 Tax=Mycobacterium sp. TaxID=1785 RepID=UPI002D6F9D88|nr:protein kinase G-activating protein GlnX [Mycobacterium sp.]HZU46470.1 protein kinase G-activating protein GlnX [Mycobacterium sp.]